MTLLHTIIIKIAGAIAAVVLFVGGGAAAPAVVQNGQPAIEAAAQDQQTTVVDVPVAPKEQAQAATPVPVSVPVPVYVVQQPAAASTQENGNIYSPAPVVIQLPAPTTTSMPNEQEQPAAAPAAPVSQARIDVISPISPLRLNGRELLARDTVRNEANQVLVAAVVYGDDGSNLRDSLVTVTTDDEAQGATLKGTGDFTGAPENVYYYAFTYDIKTTGEHTITFSANGISKTVTFTVDAEDPN